jgi:membrane protease subunit HflC
VQKLLRPLLALLFVAAVIAFAFSYTVRFTESAVVTTFGRAGEDAVISEPGLKFKWPYPIQSVTKYDSRLRVLQTRSQTQQTAANSQVVVEAFATWRVSNPLVFFQRYSNAGTRAEDHFEKAEDFLQNVLRSALGEMSKYRLDELFSDDPEASKFAELERRIFEEVVGGADGRSLADNGIEVVMVGINRVVLPEETTDKVIQKMGQVRDGLAASLESQGDARATEIRAKADADAEKIRVFAARRAAEIRAKGEMEAAEFLAQQSSEPELAVFLQNIELMKQAMAKRFTLVVSASDFGMSLFSPSALGGLGAGELPTRLPGDGALLSGQAGRGSVLDDEVGMSTEGGRR